MNAVRFNRGDLSSFSALRVERGKGTLALRRGGRPIFVTAMLVIVIGLLALGFAFVDSPSAREMWTTLVIGGVAVVFVVAMIAGFEDRNLRESSPDLVIDTARRVARIKGVVTEVDVSNVTLRLVEVMWRVSAYDGDHCDLRTTLALVGVATEDGAHWTGIGGFGARAAKIAHRLSPLAEFVKIMVDQPGGYVEQEMFDVLV